MWLVAPFSRCSGSAVRDPHVHSISIRYPSLICNTVECRVTRRTVIPALSVPHSHTPVCVHPSLTHTYPFTQRSVAHTWWTLQSVSLFDDHASARHHQPHALAIAAT